MTERSAPHHRSDIQIIHALEKQFEITLEDINSHWIDLVSQLEGCLATGGVIVRGADDDFAIEGGTSRPAFAHAYAALSPAIDAGGAQLLIKDIEEGE